MWVEAMAFFRLIGPFDAIAVELTRGNASHPNMPDVTGPMAHWIQVNDPRSEKNRQDFGRAPGEHRLRDG